MAPLLAGRDPRHSAPQPRRVRCARAGQGDACGALRDRNPRTPTRGVGGSPPGAGRAHRARPGLPLQLRRLQRPWAPRKGGCVGHRAPRGHGAPCRPLAGRGYQALRNAVQGEMEPLSSRLTLRGEASHPATAPWQGHGLLYEQKAGFVLKRPSGAVSVGQGSNSGGWCFSSDPRVTETIVCDQRALLCSRVTLRTPGRAQAHAVVLQTRLGLGGDIFDKVPTGKKDLTVRLYFPDYLAGFGSHIKRAADFFLFPV